VNAPIIQQQRLARRIFKGFVILAVLGVLGLAAFFASLWLEHRTAVTLPAPTGTFLVGRVTYDWADSSRLDTLAPVPGAKRELLVSIWYPSAAGPSLALDDYVPTAVRTEVERDRGVLLGKLLTRDLRNVHTHSIPNPDVSPQQQSYPVVIMRAGASSEVWNYSTLAEDLASHGYVVVGFDAPYRTRVVVFPDGRVRRRTPENNPELCEAQEQAQQSACVSKVLTAWTTDIAFVLDRLAELNTSDASGKFTGHLDMARVGVFGHSFGGATATQFCHDDSRCKAAVDIDGQPFGSVIGEGLSQPFMFLMSDHSRETDPESVEIMANIQSIYNRLPENRRLRVTIRGANHFLFSDDGALLKSHIVMRTLRAWGVVGIDGRRQLAVTTYCLHSFFDAYLQGPGDSRLNIRSPLYPEIEVLE
jgi:predicted dienelactone hydrolase